MHRYLIAPQRVAAVTCWGNRDAPNTTARQTLGRYTQDHLRQGRWIGGPGE